MISEPIEGLETFEEVGQAIAEILAVNLAHQQTLAADPDIYAVDVYEESTRPWEALRNGQKDAVINVTFEQDTDDPRRGDPVQQQTFTGIYNVDIIARSSGESDGAGDMRASYRAQQIAGIARRIIMAGENTYLGLRGKVSRRRVKGRQMLDPPKNGQLFDFVVCRVTIEVDYIERSPQVEAVQLESVNVEILDGSGQVVVQFKP